MLSGAEATRLVGAVLRSGDGQNLGRVEDLITHAADDRAAWAVTTVGDRRVLVPLDEASSADGVLNVHHKAESIVSAPEHDGEELDAPAAHRFYRHYGINDSVLRENSGLATEQGHSPEQGTARNP